MLTENVALRLHMGTKVTWQCYGINTPFEVTGESLRAVKLKAQARLGEMFMMEPKEISLVELHEHKVSDDPEVWVRTFQDEDPDAMLWRRTIREQLLTPPPSFEVFSHGTSAHGDFVVQVCFPTDFVADVKDQVGTTGTVYLTNGVNWRALSNDPATATSMNLRELLLADSATIEDLFDATEEGQLLHISS